MPTCKRRPWEDDNANGHGGSSFFPLLLRVMADDPYSVLGLTRGASEKDVSRAFRRLAKKYHPDVNGGTAAAEERFKAITAAHDYLMARDPEPAATRTFTEPYDYEYVAELERKLRERRGTPPGFWAKLRGKLGKG